MPWVEFDPRFPVFERTKTFHALGPAATVIGFLFIIKSYFFRVVIYRNHENIKKYTKGKNILFGSKFKTENFDVIENVCVQIWNQPIIINLKSWFSFMLIYLNLLD
jgi:hypothetical protein